MITRVFVYDFDASKLVFLNPPPSDTELGMLDRLIQTRHKFDSLVNLERTEFNFNGVEHFTQVFGRLLVGAAGISVGRSKRFLFKMFEKLNQQLETFGVGHTESDQFYEFVAEEVSIFNSRTPDVSPTILARNVKESGGKSPIFLRKNPRTSVQGSTERKSETVTQTKVQVQQQVKQEIKHLEEKKETHFHEVKMVSENEVHFEAKSEKSSNLGGLSHQKIEPPKKTTIAQGEIVLGTERHLESPAVSRRSPIENLVLEKIGTSIPPPEMPAASGREVKQQQAEAGNNAVHQSDEGARSFDQLMLDYDAVKPRVPNRDVLFVAFTFFTISTILLALYGERVNSILSGRV